LISILSELENAKCFVMVRLCYRNLRIMNYFELYSVWTQTQFLCNTQCFGAACSFSWEVIGFCVSRRLCQVIVGTWLQQKSLVLRFHEEAGMKLVNIS